MARLPEIEQRTSVAGTSLGAGPVGRTGEIELGQAVRVVAQTAQAAKIRDLQQSYELAGSTAKALSELQSFRESLASNDDYDSHSRLFVDKARELEKSRMATFSSPLVAKLWQQDYRRAVAQQEFAVAVNAEKLKAERVRTDLGNTLFDLSNLVGVNDEQDKIVRSQAALAVERNAAGGNLDYGEKTKLLAQFDQWAAKAAIRRDMVADPALAERKLAAGAYPGLRGDVAAQWAERASKAAEAADRRRIADAEHAERIAEHKQKLEGDAAAKELDKLGPDLTANDIEARRNVLSEEDYRYFYRELRNPSGADSKPADVPLYADLRERAGRGEDVRDEARTALHAGAIRSSDYDRILGEVEQERPGWRTLGTAYLSTMSGYSELNPTPGAAQLKAAMLDEWSQWADAHKNATPEEARKMYQAIGDSHQLADQAVKILTLPWPTYGVGSRQAIDLAATAKATKDALDKGAITQEEYTRQGAIWKQWSDAMRNQQAPK